MVKVTPKFWTRIATVVLIAVILTACGTPAPERGSVSGTLRFTGGIVVSPDDYLTGTVTLAHGSSRYTASAPDGRFTIEVPPGIYTVTGRSPHYEAGLTSCPGGTMHVELHQTSTVMVMCEGL